MKELDAQLPPSLATYFAAAVPLVFDELSRADDERRAHEFAARLGAANDPRLALARSFVRWQAIHAMRSLFAGLESAWNAHEAGRFDVRIARWIDERRASSGDPSSIGVGFAEALEDEARADPTIPAWVPEMADLAELAHTLKKSARTGGLVPHAVRFYQHRPYTTEPAPGAHVLYRTDDGAVKIEPIGRAHALVLAEAAGEDVTISDDERADAAPLLLRLA